MYRRCIFCAEGLGANQTLERFTVGAQVAFDPEKGRMWSICLRCGRWNLAPIEERWEAVENAERSFRSTSLRAHHENIGIARLPDGLLLVRVGSAPPAELAAWRYGTELRRRRRYHRIAQTLNVISAITWGVWIPSSFTQSRRLVLASGKKPLRLGQLDGAEFTIMPDGIRFDVQARAHWRGSVPRVSLAQGEAYTVLRRVLTAVNHRGADSVLLHGALSRLAQVGQNEDYLSRLAGGNAGCEARSLELRRLHGSWCLVRNREDVEDDPYAYPPGLDEPLSLAMEMALQEQLERDALAGHLAQLRSAWREAEEIATIADSL